MPVKVVEELAKTVKKTESMIKPKKAKKSQAKS